MQVIELFDGFFPVLPHPLLQNEPVLGPLFTTDSFQPDFMLYAYSMGFFPWGRYGVEPAWWFTMPRFVLKPQDVHVGKNLRKVIRSGVYQCSLNQDFDFVVNSCATAYRKEVEGTWLDSDLISAMKILHQRGWAHSVEVRDENGLICGGLYGLAIGKLFFGESMFHFKDDASKVGFVFLCNLLNELGFELIDCQMETPLFRAFGADCKSGLEFFNYLRQNWYSDARLIQ